ncbi:hypothetical protein DRP04_11750 [Archaeoglobales archaeon]|nr:MAG: hypothetical protein DRP04_11750 [Archaeoglobales archaeon]
MFSVYEVQFTVPTSRRIMRRKIRVPSVGLTPSELKWIFRKLIEQKLRMKVRIVDFELIEGRRY